jgi:hypothetical protein
LKQQPAQLLDEQVGAASLPPVPLEPSRLEPSTPPVPPEASLPEPPLPPEPPPPPESPQPKTAMATSTKGHRFDKYMSSEPPFLIPAKSFTAHGQPMLRKDPAPNQEGQAMSRPVARKFRVGLTGDGLLSDSEGKRGRR